MKPDLYERVTNQIIAEMEKGVCPWCKPWKDGFSLPVRSTGEKYNGVNIVLLWMAMFNHAYEVPRFLTFKQAKNLNAHVKKGEKGHLVVKYGTFTPKDAEVTAERGDEETKIPFLKGYTVFNAEQIEGLPGEYYTDEVVWQLSPEQRIAKAEAFVAATGVRIIHHGPSSFYKVAEDSIVLPHFELFHSPEDYYATLLHELAHWTGAKTRLDRTKGKAFGDKDYAFEELVAELAACFVGSSLGLRVDVDNSAAYLDTWMKCLKNDKRFFFKACRKAQAAADYLFSFQEIEQEQHDNATNCNPLDPR